MKSPIAPVITLSLALTAAPDSDAASLTTMGPAPAPGRGASTRVEASPDEPRLESLPVRGSSIARVRATVAVNAPADRVRSVVFDYARYPEFMPRYEKASVIRTTPAGGRLVQMELGGLVHLWMRVEISPPVRDAYAEAYEGRLVAGNVKAFQARWVIEPLGGERTRLTVESFLDPDLPLVPSSLVNSGARDGIHDAIVALKARIEGQRASGR